MILWDDIADEVRRLEERADRALWLIRTMKARGVHLERVAEVRCIHKTILSRITELVESCDEDVCGMPKKLRDAIDKECESYHAEI